MYSEKPECIYCYDLIKTTWYIYITQIFFVMLAEMLVIFVSSVKKNILIQRVKTSVSFVTRRNK